MTDTTGTPDSGSVRKRIRARIPAKVAVGPGGTATLSGQGFAVEEQAVWDSLASEGVLDNAFSNSEIVELLIQFSTFVEYAATQVIASIERQFGVARSDPFSHIQRRIRASLAAQPATDFREPAQRAFQQATHRWAAALLKKTDPQSFQIGDIVRAVQRNPIKALAEGCVAVLEEYGQQVLEQALSNSDRDRVVGSAKKSYLNRLKRFLKGREGRVPWQPDVIKSTIRSFERGMRGEHE